MTGATARRQWRRRDPARLAHLGFLLPALLLLVGVVGGGMAHADLLDEAWRRGNDAFLRGDYRSAAAAFEQLDRQDVASAELVYNLGNAYYRQGQLGPAIWAWERSLALDPDADDARYNLAQARKIVARRVEDKIEGADRDPVWIRVVSQMTVSTETWLFLALYGAFFVVLALRLRSRRSGGHDDGPAWGAFAAVLGVMAALAGALLVGRVALDRVPFAIVLPDAVAVKEGADPNYRTTFDVHAGLRVRLLDRDQDWVRIRLANGLDGWVPEKTVGRL
ncbi:MAG: tetratricopeptide repeat protein [Bacteroidota bacterium]